jgi:hypothetical protein
VNQINPRKALAAAGVLCVALLGIFFIGCSNGRPSGVADQPGDNYIELSDLNVELDNNSRELKIRVHYKFPDDIPHPDSWFQFAFQVNDGKSGTITVRKQGRELQEEGDMDASGSPAFLIRKSVRVGAKVQQGKSKAGPWHDVSDTVVTDS